MPKTSRRLSFLPMSRRQLACLSAAGAGLLMALWLRDANAQTVVTDATGAKVTIADSSRIASLGGGITETLYALGAASRIVAIDSTSQFPPVALKEKRNVGYVRALSTEGVLSTTPSVILTLDSAGPPEVIKALRASGVPLVAVEDALTPESVTARIRVVATAAGLADAGEALAADVTKRFAKVAAIRATIKGPKRVLFIIGAQGARATIGGDATSADAILKLAGAQNAAQSVQGFKPVSDESIIEMQPDVVVIMRRGADATADEQAIGQLKAMRGIAETPAGKSGRFIAMDGVYLLGFGPRAPSAAYDLLRAIYPELGLAAWTE